MGIEAYVQVIGGQPQRVDLADGATIASLKVAKPQFANYQAAINGNPAVDTDVLSNFDIITFSEKVKGA